MYFMPSACLSRHPAILSSHYSSLTPSFLSNTINGHQLVDADCSRFNPIKTVNHNQFGLINANDRLIITLLLAIKRIH